MVKAEGIVDSLRTGCENMLLRYAVVRSQRYRPTCW